MLTAGDIYGTVFENNLFSEHKIMVPPRAKGRVTRIAERGNYTIDDKILTLEYDGKTTEYTMAHWWPVR
jgi:vacuolar-type H+-ATPase catalytic subunit A/Vma1